MEETARARICSGCNGSGAGMEESRSLENTRHQDLPKNCSAEKAMASWEGGGAIDSVAAPEEPEELSCLLSLLIHFLQSL